MPNPTSGDVHVNAPLTNISVAYIQDASRFVASRVFPVVPVNRQSDRYYTYDRGDFNRDEMKRRAPGTESVGGGYDLDAAETYYCDVWAYHKDVPDQVRGNQDAPIESDRDATLFVTQKGLIRREKAFAEGFFTSGVWGTDMGGVSATPTSGEFLQWNDANADPVGDIRAAKRDIAEGTGFEANVMVLGRPVYDALVDHPDIIDRVKYGQTPGKAATVTRDALAALFEVDEVLVMNAVENAATEGQAESTAFIGGKKALLCHRAEVPGLLTPSAGYTFAWKGLDGAGEEGARIKRFRMEHLAAERIEIEMAFDLKLIGADLGTFFDAAVA